MIETICSLAELMFQLLLKGHLQNLWMYVKNSLLLPSVSAGLGLIYQFDPVRVELNFGMPLTMLKGDGCRRGIQVGIGLDFL
jgi:hypothetical protein